MKLNRSVEKSCIQSLTDFEWPFIMSIYVAKKIRENRGRLFRASTKKGEREEGHKRLASSWMVPDGFWGERGRKF